MRWPRRIRFTKRSARAGKVSDIVVLVPGFLGFDHFGGYPYSAQVADHLDVIGNFPSESPFAAPSEFSGFLSSGSEFRAPELSQLYRSVAEQIARAISVPC